MAIGFKVADAYVAVHTEDDTKRGRDKIKRDAEKWSRDTGSSMGTNMLRGLLRGLLGFGRILTTFTMLTSKFLLLGVAAGSALAAVAGLLGGVVNLLPVISQLVTAAITAAGALLLIPAAIATLVIGIGTLKLGLQGVGAALKAGLAGDAEALNAAVAKLAPNAAAFVREVVKLKPAFDRVRLQIQNSLFTDLADLLRKMADAYLPIINVGLDKMAVVINKVFRTLGEFLLGANTKLDMGTILANAATAAGNLASALEPALEILRDVLVVSTGVAAELSTQLRPMFLDWADTIAAMRNDGSLAKLITDGLDVLKQFGALALDILGILKGIFGAAGSNGGGLFVFFDKLNKFINSATGQTAIGQLFDALQQAASALFPVLIVLLQALVPLLYAISTIAVQFAPGLMVAVNALGQALLLLLPGFLALAPLLTVIADGFAPLAQIISDLVVGIGPYAQLFFTQVVEVLKQLAPVAEPVGHALGLILAVVGDLLVLLAPLVADGLQLLADVLIAILEPLEPLIRDSLPLFTKLIHEIFDALQPVIPALSELAIAFVQNFLQFLPQMMPVFKDFAGILLILAQTVSGELVQALQDLIPYLPQLFISGIQLAIAFAQLAIAITPLLILLVKLLGDSGQLQIAVPILAGLITFLSAAITDTAKVVTFWIDILRQLWHWLTDSTTVVQSFGTAVMQRIGAVLDVFQNLGGTILSALGNFGGLLWNAGWNLISGLISGVKSAIPNLSGVMGWIAGMVREFWPFSPAKRGPLSGRGDMLNAGQNLVSRLVQGIQLEIGSARGAADNLAGMFGMNGQGAFALAGAGGPAGAAGQAPVYVMVQIGDRPVRDMVKGEIVANPEAVAAATDEGHRQAAFQDPSRRRVGSS